ncbi:MAG: hypothetical protein AB1942_14240 [Pseudomonadota bacterium]
MAGRKLKVFQAQLGFYDTVVAAPSQAAALRAWGTHQNLFASGQACVTDDPQAIEAARAHPLTPLKRAIGSRDPFALKATSLPAVPEAPAGSRPSRAAKGPAKPEAPERPPADRSELNAAERALQVLDERRKTQEARLRRDEDELEARRTATQVAYSEARRAAAAKVRKARAAYRDAGGED